MKRDSSLGHSTNFEVKDKLETGFSYLVSVQTVLLDYGSNFADFFIERNDPLPIDKITVFVMYAGSN